MFKLKLINKPKMIKLKCGFSFPNIVLANLQEKEVIPTKNIQNIVADFPFDGLSKVTVNPIPDEYIIPSGEIEFTQNGTYDVTDKASAKVNVPEKQLGTKTITQNGTYNASDDNLDGYSQVTVETSGVDINDYFYNDFSLNGGFYSNSTNLLRIIKKVSINNTGTNLGYAFQSYAGEIIEFKPSVAKQLINIKNMFYNCTKLKKITGFEHFDISKITSMSNLFRGCNLLTEIPALTTTNVTDMSYMFGETEVLKSIPLIDTTNVTDMNNMFFRSGVNEIPLLSTSKVTNMSNICAEAYNLQVFPALDTSNVTNFAGAFQFVKTLKEVKKLNFSKVQKIDYIFYYCSNLITLGGFENLGANYLESSNANYSDYKLDLSSCTKLTHDSLMNVINNLYDIAAKGVKTQQLVIGTANKKKLTAEEIQIATQRGWSVS